MKQTISKSKKKEAEQIRHYCINCKRKRYEVDMVNVNVKAGIFRAGRDQWQCINCKDLRKTTGSERWKRYNKPYSLR